jgi:Fe-S cluster biogenesis protein NfuA/nitrite reductase/ring-hydroxylating ferredoxin subunit
VAVTTDTGAADRVARVEALLEEVEGLGDGPGLQLAAALLDLYGEGLARLCDHLAAADADGTIARAVAGDELVSHLLLLHGLHPVPVRERVLGALAEVRPYLESHGGDVELLSVQDGVALLRLEGSCHGCPSSTLTLRHAIEAAILKAAPDVERIETDDPPAARDGLLDIEVRVPSTSWTPADGVSFGGDGPFMKAVAGTPLLFVRVDGQPYAYKPECPACGASLARASLQGARLGCTACDQRYDVRAAGACLTAPGLHLEPVPLLVDDGGQVTVAV